MQKLMVKHGGRCCVWKEGLSAVSPYASDNENDYCVLANYDRFEGGKYTGVELHGGATLEEVVVPIIRLSLKKATVTFKLSKKQFSNKARKSRSGYFYSFSAYGKTASQNWRETLCPRSDR